jgi:hypothetical protein
MATVDDVSERDELAALADRLVLRFCPPLCADEVRQCTFEVVGEFVDAPVRTYVALLTERIVVTRLTAMATGRRTEQELDSESSSAALLAAGGA